MNARIDAASAVAPTRGPLAAMRRSQHPDCFVCDAGQPHGLRVDYRPHPDGGVYASVCCPRLWQGYTGLVHGGVIACLLDGAMTHCLFSEQVAAVTAALDIRYRHPLQVDQPAVVAAHVVRRSPPLFVLEAVITQADQRQVTACGKFMQTPQRPLRRNG
jgi:acyl-coenzyme A thioesterase PaaI-like protein